MKHALGCAALAACALALTTLSALAGPEVALETTQGARAAFVHASDSGDYGFGSVTWGMYIMHVSGDGVPTQGTLAVTAGGRTVRLNCSSDGCRSKLIELKGAVAGHVGS